MSNAQQTKRANLIGRALQIARAHKEGGAVKREEERRAEGGEVSFKDMLETNPKGWGTAAPEPVWKRDPEAFVGEARGPAERPKDALAPVAENPAIQLMTPIPGMKAIDAGLGLAARYASKPAVAGGVAAGLGFGAGTASSGPEDISPEAEINRLTAEKAKLVEARDAASKQFLATSGAKQAELKGKGKGKSKGVGPLSNALGETAKGIEQQAARYNSEIDKIDARLEKLQFMLTPEYQQEQDLIKTNIDARKPWYERTGIPGFETAASWGPTVGAAALMRAKMNKVTQEGIDLVQKIRTASNVGEEAAARVALQAWQKSAPAEARATLAKTVLLPGAVRTAGMAGDATFGPEVKDKEGRVLPGGAKSQAQHHLGRMFGAEGAQGALEEWGPPVLQGLEAASAGAMLAKRAPWGQINAETAYLKGIENPDATPFQKFLGRGDARSMSPDQIALELAKRRSGVQSAQMGLDGVPMRTPAGPTPLWSQSMRGESTNPALPPPGGSGPSGTSQARLPAPSTTSSQTAGPEAPLRPEAVPSQSAPSSSTPQAKKSKAASRLLRHYKKDRVKKWKEPHGSIKHKNEKGLYTSAPAKAKAQTSEAGGQETSAEDYLSDPDKLTSGMATGGTVGGRMLAMAKRYANGGTVGPLVGKTGGRADKLATSVPAGSHVIPADVIAHHGEGNTLAGLEKMRAMFGDAPSRAAGGEVPVYLSDGEYVVSPEGVAKAGGHEALDRFILKSRADHIKTLQNLPPPARD